MSGTPFVSLWDANRAVDDNTNQNYSYNSCAISHVDEDKLKKSYWKVWLAPKAFNIAYLEIYFRSDSK